MEYKTICVCIVVSKCLLQSFQESLLCCIFNWVSLVQLLSLQLLRIEFEVWKEIRMEGEWATKEERKRRKENESIFILPWPQWNECPYTRFQCDTWKTFWQACLSPEVSHLGSTDLQPLKSSIRTGGFCRPSLRCMQNNDYRTGHKLCYFLHLTKNCSFIEGVIWSAHNYIAWERKLHTWLCQGPFHSNF